MSFYLAARAASELGLATMVGFVHVPLLPELVDQPERQPSMARALQAAGLDCVIDAGRTGTDRAGLYL
jgi:pyrrolidone-carboxylate peptidase